MGLQDNQIILKNNQAEYADLLVFDILTFRGVRIEYSITRADQTELGDIHLSYNRITKTAQITTEANFDDVGIRFCATVDNVNIRLVYKTTNTGVQALFKYNLIYFAL